jgi:Flp pilus assembly protein TadD
MPVLERQSFSERMRDARIVATASDDDIMALYREIADPFETAEGVRRTLLAAISVEPSGRTRPSERTRKIGPYWLVPRTAVALIVALVFALIAAVFVPMLRRAPNKHQDSESGTVVVSKPLKASAGQVDKLLELAVRALEQKRYEDAGEEFRRAYELDPSNLRGLLGMAEVYFQLDQPDKAVQAIAHEVRKTPQRLDLRKELANTEFRAGQFDRAIADYGSLIDRIKDSPIEQAELYARIGTTYSRAGDTQQAVENLQKARQLNPTNVAYITQFAQFLDMMGRHSEAVTAYREALKLEPDNAVVLNNLAYLITVTGGDLDEALSMALRAQQQLPQSTEVSDTLGWIYIKKSLSDRAIETFRDLTSKVNDNSTFHYHYAIALAQKGDDADALSELKTALEYGPREREEMEIKALIEKISGR